MANSEITRRRIAEFYGRDATVVHPPVDINRFTCEPDPQDYVLSVGEVTRHKNTELALAAAERAGITIRVVGEGPDLERLRARYRRAEFLGRVDDRRLAELYAGCRALVVPAVEEFGITMVEALSAGRPVLAAASGGALEIVTDGETGVLVKPRSVDAMAEALRATDWEGFDVARLRARRRALLRDPFPRAVRGRRLGNDRRSDARKRTAGRAPGPVKCPLADRAHCRTGCHKRPRRLN